MNLKEGIKKYIADNGLQAKCDERKITIDAICDYVTDEARKALNGHSGAIDDTTVFNWVVHYIEDIAYKEKPAQAENKPVKPEPEPVEVKPVKHEPVKHEETQLNLFDL